MSTQTVEASEVRSDQDGVGDMIPGLDHAYVYRMDDDGEEVTLLLHDGVGGEASLTCARDMPITIKRRA